MNEQPTSVPIEPYLQALTEQRNDALNLAAERQALIAHYRAENERLTEENNKLRADSDGPFADS